MNKNDGYTLPFVVVVLLVLAIVATTIMTGSLTNLQRQQRLIDQMEARYEAQGQIEELVAKLENASDTNEISDILGDYTDTDVDASPVGDVSNNMDITVCSVYDTVQIDCVLNVEIAEDKTMVTYTSYEVKTKEVPVGENQE